MPSSTCAIVKGILYTLVVRGDDGYGQDGDSFSGCKFCQLYKGIKSSMGLQLWMHGNGHLIKAKHVLDIAGNNPVVAEIRHRGHQPAVVADRQQLHLHTDLVLIATSEVATTQRSNFSSTLSNAWGFLLIASLIPNQIVSQPKRLSPTMLSSLRTTSLSQHTPQSATPSSLSHHQPPRPPHQQRLLLIRSPS
ncbi:hypothetical protein BC936DRAFT_139171 [Jimgerdemannia flammicorona]|uniref:Uncharacterized protein n=1 Tax=Jimgerdemannia flammicorona TaxID=994334 RepID=A0A433BAH9_9FUNG|nr:hypothetical protein BC936DRAFT_139171 [Jimgerdemannia flammicorona]